MRRVFGLDVLRCRTCRSYRRRIALITERTVIVAILSHLGLETDPPATVPARAPTPGKHAPSEKASHEKVSGFEATPDGSKCVRAPVACLNPATRVKSRGLERLKSREPRPIRRSDTPTSKETRGFRSGVLLGKAAWSTYPPAKFKLRAERYGDFRVSCGTGS
jgi:hypothetical protein